MKVMNAETQTRSSIRRSLNSSVGFQLLDQTPLQEGLGLQPGPVPPSRRGWVYSPVQSPSRRGWVYSPVQSSLIPGGSWFKAVLYRSQHDASWRRFLYFIHFSKEESRFMWRTFFTGRISTMPVYVYYVVYCF